MRKFAFLQRRRVEGDLTGIPDIDAIREQPLQFAPAHVRAVLGKDLDALVGHMGGQRLLGVFGGELASHGVGELRVGGLSGKNSVEP